ncbi:hypothetical protein HZA43_05100 [Candidatus Peregrinibacteria bacterium]|nr:hypothetical protein [Candidatus Peregrinibacteria bacterium]
MKFVIRNFRRGAALMEVTIAIALFVMVAPTILTLGLGGLQSVFNNKIHLRTLFLVQEGLEATRSIRDYDWNSLSLGTHGLADASGFWEWNGASDTQDGYVRTVTVTSIDPDTKEITSRVQSPTAFSSALTTTLTRWRYSDFRQTTATDFNAGTLSSVVVTTTGDGEVKLATGSSSGTFISSAFNTGSYSPRYQTLFWTQSGTGTLKFQIRTADTQAALGAAVWVGPNGINSTFYTTSDSVIVPDPGRSGDQWVQYQVTLEGDGTNSPILESITIRYIP